MCAAKLQLLYCTYLDMSDLMITNTSVNTFGSLFHVTLEMVTFGLDDMNK